MRTAFVYGAQMVHPESFERGRAALVEDHAVVFTAPGLPVLEPVFANLERAPGERAYGVVTEFDDETWARLREDEASYRVYEVRARLLSGGDEARGAGEEVACAAFVLGRRHRVEPGRPSARYARKLLEGAHHHGLPDAVVRRYERAVAEGSRVSLALAWMQPLALRLGLRTTAVLVGLLAVALLVLAARCMSS